MKILLAVIPLAFLLCGCGNNPLLSQFPAPITSAPEPFEGFEEYNTGPFNGGTKWQIYSNTVNHCTIDGSTVFTGAKSLRVSMPANTVREYNALVADIDNTSSPVVRIEFDMLVTNNVEAFYAGIGAVSDALGGDVYPVYLVVYQGKYYAAYIDSSSPGVFGYFISFETDLGNVDLNTWTRFKITLDSRNKMWGLSRGDLVASGGFTSELLAGNPNSVVLSTDASDVHSAFDVLYDNIFIYK